MASMLFCFLSFLSLCISLGDAVQGRGLQMIHGSNKTESILYTTSEELVASKHNSLDARIGGYHNGKGRSKTYDENHDLALERARASAFNLSVDKRLVLHWALVYTKPKIADRYNSARASLNVYGLPQVANNQASTSALWVMNVGEGSERSVDTIQAGWHVFPELYGDTDTHFFVSWTADHVTKRGCYNLLCEGFKLDKSSDYIPGSKIRPLSTYNGKQYVITMNISKDPETGDWWLYHGPKVDKAIGYWPKSLFTGLQGSANHIECGGVVAFYKYDKMSPPMGSGHFPSEGHKKAASLSDIEYDGIPYNPMDANNWFAQTQKSCYLIDNGYTLYFGGPGGCLD